MNATRFRECLIILHWSSLTLADLLHTTAGTVMAWYYGREVIPDAVGEWLDTLVRAHEAAPPPIGLIHFEVPDSE
jgi:hypothetical protein